ncbi:hypothetical protein C8R43DRAFT_1108067 [Mycena crocata]|nr:hypothetical protein C8R43DRAFT_1108067 [Mycena crocata]
MFNPAFFLQKKAAGRHTPLLHAMPHCCCQPFNPNVVLAPGRRRAAAPALILRYIAFPRAAQNLWAGPPRHEIKCSVVVGSPTHITTHRLPVSSTICPYGSRSPPSKFDFWVSRKLHGDTGVAPTSNTILQPSRCSKTLSPLRDWKPGTKIRFLRVPRTSSQHRSPSSPHQLPASDTTHPVPPPNLARDQNSIFERPANFIAAPLQVSHFFLCLRRVFGLGFGLTSDKENKQDRVLIDLEFQKVSPEAKTAPTRRDSEIGPGNGTLTC